MQLKLTKKEGLGCGAWKIGKACSLTINLRVIEIKSREGHRCGEVNYGRHVAWSRLAVVPSYLYAREVYFGRPLSNYPPFL